MPAGTLAGAVGAGIVGGANIANGQSGESSNNNQYTNNATSAGESSGSS